MTRPMPGPPEHCYCRNGDQPCRSCMDDDGFYPGGVCPGCTLHNGDRGPRDTRLKDVECAAEYWMWAAASERVRAFIAISRKPGESVTANLDFQRAFHEQVTWHRFATHPHALEES